MRGLDLQTPLYETSWDVGPKCVGDDQTIQFEVNTIT